MKGRFVQQMIDGSNPIVVSSKKILRLTLMRKWFDQIADGIKKVEYREVKPYYISLLFDNHGILIPYDYIFFRNGYSRDSPTLMVEYNGVIGISDFENVKCFELGLGSICENAGMEKETLSEEEKVADKREKIMGFR